MCKIPLFPVLAAMVLGGIVSSEASKKPNILFIFADDQCFQAIQALGCDEIETPNIDRLVANGTTFTHAYNMGSWTGAVCVASRQMLNTGAFLWHAEKIARKPARGGKKKATEENSADPWPDFQEKGWMWSQLMKAAGYETYFTGKWHVNADPARIFHHVKNVRGGMPKQTPEGYNRPIDGQPDPWSPCDPKFGGFWEGGRHWSEVVGDDAEEFLERAKGSQNPFFMYIAFNAPHDPRQSPKEYVDRYPLKKIKLPANFLREYPFKDQIDCGAELRDEKLAPFPRTERAVKVNRQEYYAIITHMDDQIGRILDTLEATGQRKNTWIFFSADHGLAVGQHGLMGKQNLFDHSVRVPFVVVGPGVEPGVRSHSRIYLQDVMPTTLELAGAEIPEHVQFRSIKPILDGEPGGYRAIYGAYLQSQRSITAGSFKLVLYPKAPKALLFNLDDDPHEMNDLAGNPKYKKRIRTLFGQLQELQKETGDTLDLEEAFPDL